MGVSKKRGIGKHTHKGTLQLYIVEDKLGILDLLLDHHGWFTALRFVTHASACEHLGTEWQHLSRRLITRTTVDERPIGLEHKIRVLQTQQK